VGSIPIARSSLLGTFLFPAISDGCRLMSIDGPQSIEILIDADACPVKAEVYKVAERYGVKTWVVANSHIHVPREPLIERVVVAAGPDVADDWIAERARRGIIVITADVPLAARCVKAGADAIAPNGRAFTEQAMGMALAARNLMDQLRSEGQTTRGPPPFSARDRSAFLSALDLALVRLRRAGFG
jgi:uncharacterized protein YaiI (UPF0178 family)